MMSGMNCPHNIYIHVPFCISKCKYCAFYSVANLQPDWKKYADGICSELQFWAEKLGRITIPTVFFGGGTPSLMPTEIFAQIISCIQKYFDLDENCEISLESNPGTLDANKLRDFVRCGVNRLSVGVQSLTDSELEFLGRKHNVRQALNLLENAQNMNLRVSGDFIYGLPNHNEKSVENLCNQINQLNLEHVSMYELTIEKHTPFGQMNLNMPDNENMARMYETIQGALNLPRYEVSNYAMPGQECRHNQNIWWGGAYIGIGRGGAGRVNIDGVWYDEMGNNERFEKISDKTRTIEKIITGIRTTRGVELDSSVLNQINTDWVKKHNDLVALSDKYLYALPKGFLILDNLILDLIK